MSNLRIRAAALGVAALACLAFAPFASALSYKGEVNPTYVTAEGSGSLVIQAGAKITCTGSKSKGKIEGGSTETLTMSAPTLTGCTIAGQAATATGGPHIEDTASTFTGPAVWHFFRHLTYTASSPWVFTATTSGCTIKFGAQSVSGLMEVEGKGSGSSRDLSISGGVSGLSYTGSGGICGGSGTNGTLSISQTERGYSDEAHTKQVGLFIE